MILIEWKFGHTFTGCEQSRRDQLLLQEELSEQNRDLREARIKSLNEMEELKRVQELRVDESSRRLIENQDTINELTARIHELQNEVNRMNDARDFKDAESVRSGPSHVDIWNSQDFTGNVFLQVHERLLRHLIQENSIVGFLT